MTTSDDVSYAATAVTILLMAAQLPAMWRVIRITKCVENLSVFPTVGQTSNFVSWVVYGVRKGDPNIYRVNAIGCGFMFLYVSIFLLYSAGVTRRNLVITLVAAGACLAAVLVGISVTGGLNDEQKESGLGAFAVACNTVMYAAPLSQLVRPFPKMCAATLDTIHLPCLAVQQVALKSMDPTSIPFALTIVGTITSILWLVYGILVNNWFVGGPNAAGVGLGVVQLLVIWYIYLRVWQDPSLRKHVKENDLDTEPLTQAAHGYGHDGDDGAVHAASGVAQRKSTKPAIDSLP